MTTREALRDELAAFPVERLRAVLELAEISAPTMASSEELAERVSKRIYLILSPQPNLFSISNRFETSQATLKNNDTIGFYKSKILNRT